MKCDKCGKEATFYYKSSINNVTTECHLCAECSQAEGYGDVFTQALTPVFDGFWSGAPAMLNAFMTPFTPYSGSVFSQMPAFPFFALLPPQQHASTKVEETNADNVPEDAGELFRVKREINSLRHQMQEAVKAEDFEKAALLRDKIHEMEK